MSLSHGRASVELPPSAIEILKSTYASVTHHLRLSHKQRRKIWKKEKRRKKRIINFFANQALNGFICKESSSSEEDISGSADLPIGTLTNYAIISHFQSHLSDETEHTWKSRGILKNSDEKIGDISQPSVSGTNDEIFANVAGETLGTSVSQLGVFSPEIRLENSASGSKSVDLSNKIKSAVIDVPNFNTVLEDSLRDPDERPPADSEFNRSKQEKDEIAGLLAQLDEEVGRWQNPPAPPHVEVLQREENKISDAALRPGSGVTSAQVENDNRQICTFYSRVGACRFWNKCSRKHIDPESSDALVFPNMFQSFSFKMEDRARLIGDAHDLSLEHTEQDLLEEFRDFYADVEPEFRQIGHLLHLYICRNRVKHLQGNVYVQYKSANDALRCRNKMLGRFFAGRRLFCKFLHIQSWGETLCGVDVRRGTCSRGGQCNFLHVFQDEKRGSNELRYSSRENFSPRWSTSRPNRPRHSLRSETWSNRRRSLSSERSRYRRNSEGRSRRFRHSSRSSSCSSDVDGKSSSRKRKRNGSSTQKRRHKKKRKREHHSTRSRNSSYSDAEKRKSSTKEKKKSKSHGKCSVASPSVSQEVDFMSSMVKTNIELDTSPSNSFGTEINVTTDKLYQNEKGVGFVKNLKSADVSFHYSVDEPDAQSRGTATKRKKKKAKRIKKNKKLKSRTTSQSDGSHS